MWKQVLALFIVMCLFIVNLFAQAQSMQWMKDLGRTNPGEGHCVQQTSDGGYIITGYVTYEVKPHLWLIKTNAAGNTLWTKTFEEYCESQGHFVQQTNDRGYIITGYVNYLDLAAANHLWVIKTDAKGNKLWVKTFDSRRENEGYCVRQTLDNGYIIAGYTYHGEIMAEGEFAEEKMEMSELSRVPEKGKDVWVIKINASGDTLWTKTFGGSDDDCALSVQQTIDSGYVIVGYTGRNDEREHYSDVCLIKIDRLGNKQWDKTFGGTYPARGNSIQKTSDNGYIITGCTGAYGEDANVWLIKTDSLGNKLWDKTFGGTNFDVGTCVQQTTDDGYIIVGATGSYGYGTPGALNVWLIKTNPVGDTLWTRTFGGTDDDIAYSVEQTRDNGYIITGYTGFKYGKREPALLLIKTDSLGNTIVIQKE